MADRVGVDVPERTCSMPECGKPHRAKGLCSTHYNQARYTPDERHPTVTIVCEMCGSEHRTSRIDGRFCSLLCRDLWRIEYDVNPCPQVNVAPFCRLPTEHPAMWYGAVCPLDESACHACGQTFVHRPGQRTYCSARCARRAQHIRRQARRSRRKRIRRIEIFERDQFVCWICDLPCDPLVRVPHPLAPTVDHLVPQVHGGEDDADNLATAHFLCNSRRGCSWDLPKQAHEASHAA